MRRALSLQRLRLLRVAQQALALGGDGAAPAAATAPSAALRGSCTTPAPAAAAAALRPDSSSSLYGGLVATALLMSSNALTASADAQAPDSALSSAQLAVSSAFADVLADAARAAAEQAPGGGSSNSSSGGGGGGTRPSPPVVEADGQCLSVRIPLLPGVDVASLSGIIDASLDALAAAASSSSQQCQCRVMSTSRVTTWQLSRELRNPPALQPAQQQQQQQQPCSSERLTLQVVVPLQRNLSPHESSASSNSSGEGSSDSNGGGKPGDDSSGYVAVLKPGGGGFTADELALLARLVAAANQPAQASQQGLGPLMPELRHSPLARALGQLLSDLESEVWGHWTGEQQAQRQLDGQRGWLPERWRSFAEEQLPQELQRQLEQQLEELVPPELLAWLQQLQQLEEQQRQGNEQREQQRQRGEQVRQSEQRQRQDAVKQQPQQQPQQQPLPAPLLPWQQPAARAAMAQLQQLGARVYLPSPAVEGEQLQQEGQGGTRQSDWGALAGYEEQKQALEDSLLLPLQHPEVFERLASRTRAAAAGSCRPRALLFEGPPGTGKTSSARLLASRAAVPLVYVPLEGIVSKWYSESEQNLSKLFRACEGLGGAIIFLDELDSLATSRDSELHEASRRLLAVLLRELDGFDSDGPGSSGSRASGSGGSASGGSSASGAGSKRSVLIGATNRRQDLDAALLSRFGLSIHFGLPDEACRAAILATYAAHLSADERARLAAETPGFSGRDLRDACEQAERRWAAAIIRGSVGAEELPGVEQYLQAVRQRQRAGGGGGGGHGWARSGGGRTLTT